MSIASNISSVAATKELVHNSSQAAVAPQAPLGSANQGPGLGAKVLLAKKMTKSINTTFVSPTDNMMTPVSQKLNASRKKHFQNGKPVQLFSQKGDVAQSGDGEDDGGDDVSESSNTTDAKKTSLPPLKDDDENPF